MKAWILWAILGQAGDITTTAIGLNRGCVEQAWPYSMAPRVGLAAKTGGTVFVTITLGSKPTKGAKAVLGILGASGAAATAWNLTQLPRC